MDVNALNYCRFSLFSTSTIGSTTLPEDPTASTSRVPFTQEFTALVALPNLVESSEVCNSEQRNCRLTFSLRQIYGYCLHFRECMLESVNAPNRQYSLEMAEAEKIPPVPLSTICVNNSQPTYPGIIMALHVFETSSSSPELRILIAYENGTVTLRRYINLEKAYSVEGQGWEIIWDAKLHQEASESNFIHLWIRKFIRKYTVMAMQVSSDSKLALTVSADHLIGRYDLTVSLT